MLNEDLEEVMLLRFVKELDLSSISLERELAISEARTIEERNRIADQQAANQAN